MAMVLYDCYVAIAVRRHPAIVLFPAKKVACSVFLNVFRRGFQTSL